MKWLCVDIVLSIILFFCLMPLISPWGVLGHSDAFDKFQASFDSVEVYSSDGQKLGLLRPKDAHFYLSQDEIAPCLLDAVQASYSLHQVCSILLEEYHQNRERGVLEGFPFMHEWTSWVQAEHQIMILQKHYKPRELYVFFLNRCKFLRKGNIYKVAYHTFGKKTQDIKPEEGCVLVHPDLQISERELLFKEIIPQDTIAKRNELLTKMGLPALCKRPLTCLPKEPPLSRRAYSEDFLRQEWRALARKHNLPAYGKGIKLYLTLDSRLQRIAQSIVKKMEEKYTPLFEKEAEYHKKKGKLLSLSKPSYRFLAIEPNTNKIKGWVGGNASLQSYNFLQPTKHLYFALLFEQGLTTQTPIEKDQDNNYNTIQDIWGDSIHTPYLIGIFKYLKNYLPNTTINSYIEDIWGGEIQGSLVLIRSSWLELMQFYALFTNGGIKQKTRLIEAVHTPKGHLKVGQGRQDTIFKPKTCEQMRQLFNSGFNYRYNELKPILGNQFWTLPNLLSNSNGQLAMISSTQALVLLSHINNPNKTYNYGYLQHLPLEMQKLFWQEMKASPLFPQQASFAQ